MFMTISLTLSVRSVPFAASQVANLSVSYVEISRSELNDQRRSCANQSLGQPGLAQPICESQIFFRITVREIINVFINCKIRVESQNLLR